VEGGITVDGESVPNNTNYHILNYVDMSAAGNCEGQGSCWIQVGNALGYTYLGGYPHSCQTPVTTVEAFMEEGDVNTYICTAYTPGQISLQQNDYYTTYYTGTCNGANQGLVNGYVYNGVNWILIGQAWLPGCASSTIYAQSEFDSFNLPPNNGPCPVLNQNEYFGSGGWVLYQSADGANWTQWTTSLTHGPNAPLQMYPTNVSGWNNFRTWG
jgi:hypothetical protein